MVDRYRRWADDIIQRTRKDWMNVEKDRNKLKKLEAAFTQGKGQKVLQTQKQLTILSTETFKLYLDLRIVNNKRLHYYYMNKGTVNHER